MMRFCVVVFSSLLLAALVHADGCVDRASNSLPMPGGWFEVDLAENGDALDTAVELAQFALNFADESNQLPNWKGKLPTVEPDDIKGVWTQVVAGTHYCLKFSSGRGNSRHQLDCEAQVFKPLPVYEANGSQETTVHEITCV